MIDYFKFVFRNNTNIYIEVEIHAYKNYSSMYKNYTSMRHNF